MSQAEDGGSASEPRVRSEKAENDLEWRAGKPPDPVCPVEAWSFSELGEERVGSELRREKASECALGNNVWTWVPP